MTCNQCGAQNESAAFCTRCGSNMQAVAQPVYAPAPAAPQYTQQAGTATAPAYAPQPQQQYQPQQPQQPYFQQQQPQYGYPQQVPVAAGPVYAEFIVRFFALLIDEFLAFSAAGIAYGIFVLLAMAIGAVTGGGEGGFVGLFFGLILGGTAATLTYITYFVKLETGPKQATLGKQMLGIKICNAQGGRISVLQSLGRLIVKDTFSLFFFMAGYIMAAFTEKKQALHDFVASSYVVKA
jgi:uncharacterized RDD family membrane protein YckC